MRTCHRHGGFMSVQANGGQTKVTLRPAELADVPAIKDIYNHYVTASTATFDLQEQSLDERLIWFEEHQLLGYPMVVAEIGGKLVGWGSLSRYHSRCAYSQTVEASWYVHHQWH